MALNLMSQYLAWMVFDSKRRGELFHEQLNEAGFQRSQLDVSNAYLLVRISFR